MERGREYVYIYTHIHTHPYIYIHIIYVYVYVYIHICIYMHIYTYICIYVCIFARASLHIYIFSYTSSVTNNVYTHLSASDTRDSGQAWNEGGSDEAMMTVKDGVRRGMRVKQLAKV